jgi:hypothetical protein
MTYPRDMSTGSISTICPTVTADSSISFKASLSLQVTVKPSLAASMSPQGYREFKILRVGLTDCFILERINSWDLVGKLSSI